MSSNTSKKSGGRGRGRGWQRKSRSQKAASSKTNKKTGVSKTLGNHVFDFGPKNAADQMTTTWEQIIIHVGINMGEDIRNELRNRTRVTIPPPDMPAAAVARHTADTDWERQQNENIRDQYRQAATTLEASITATPVSEAGQIAKLTLEKANIEREIARLERAISNPPHIKLEGVDKSVYDAAVKLHTDRVKELTQHRSKAFNLIFGQCTQVLKDKMKHDSAYTSTMTGSDPLELMNLIEKIILSQSDDQYPYQTYYEQQCILLNFQQGTLSTDEYYEKFNTRCDVAAAVGVSMLHEGALEPTAQDLYQKSYHNLTDDEKKAVSEDAQERYLTYIFLHRSNAGKLKTSLREDFAKGVDHYPKDRQAALHLLDKYGTSGPSSKDGGTEGHSFVTKGQQSQQKGSKKSGAGNKKISFDPEYWKDKVCHRCKQKGHPSFIHNADAEGDKSDKKSDDSSRASKKSSKSSSSKSSSKSKSSGKSGGANKFTKAFATMLESLEEENSDLTDSDDTHSSHFTFGCEIAGVTPTKTMGEQVDHMFANLKLNSVNIDMRKAFLLDNQSTLDLVCNEELVENIREAKNPITVKSTGGYLTVTQQATLPGYGKPVWFSKRGITNILALKNVRELYWITYDCEQGAYTVHREGKPNIQFIMNQEGLHVFVPPRSGFNFVNTVAERMERFSKRQLQGAQQARELYSKLAYPSLKDFKWAITSNQIKNCPVTVQDISIAQEVWGKDIAALKGKTTRTKPVPVQQDMLKVPRDFLRLHKNVFLTIDIFFVDTIPFLLTLSRKIDFTTASHLENRKLETILKAVMSIVSLYKRRGFRIETIHADREFEPLAELIESHPRGPSVNLASANEHVPEIERRIRVVKERTRAVRHSLPFKRMPKMMTANMVLHVVRQLTFFPGKGGISANLSPRMIMMGESLDFKKHLSLQFGEYCQVHEEDTPRNSQTARTKAAICLGPSGNIQGGFKFMSLQTGKKIVRRSWDRLPMPDTVITRVNILGKGQPSQLTFKDRKGRPIGDVELTGVDVQGEPLIAQNDENGDDDLPPLIPRNPDDDDSSVDSDDLESTDEEIDDANADLLGNDADFVD